jgi:hypothetical protein
MLLFAAYTAPPQPIAMEIKAATSLRHERVAAAAGFRDNEVSAAIGDILSPAF